MPDTEKKSDKNTAKAVLYQARPGTACRGKGLEDAISIGGPKKSDYDKVLTAWLEAGQGRDLLAQLQQAFDMPDVKAHGPIGMSDVLAVTAYRGRTCFYYMDQGTVWRRTRFV